jgi:predicted HicB family RNase H-like nuclease
VNKLLNFRLKAEVKEAAEKAASARGISLSEYIRGLIIKDLEKDGFFSRGINDDAKK